MPENKDSGVRFICTKPWRCTYLTTVYTQPINNLWEQQLFCQKALNGSDIMKPRLFHQGFCNYRIRIIIKKAGSLLIVTILIVFDIFTINRYSNVFHFWALHFSNFGPNLFLRHQDTWNFGERCLRRKNNDLRQIYIFYWNGNEKMELELTKGYQYLLDEIWQQI